jgi:hypothetical protein
MTEAPATFPGGELARAALALARRFAAGATMWCIAPRWPAHSGHLAVEFVHPVIVGKRALPAVAVERPDLVDSLRLLARPGDVLAAVTSADDELAVRAVERAEIWGLTSNSIGAGPRPDGHQATHTIWLDELDPERAARGGDLVLLYHVLWELTHVVFEHPGLLTESPSLSPVACTTCADEGCLAEVRTAGPDSQAQVLMKGQVQTVDISLLGPVGYGDVVLVHGGVALTNIGDRDT